MKRLMKLAGIAVVAAAMALLLVVAPDYSFAQESGKPEKGYADENGDGLNDNARDADGDGIPNGKDPDYVRQNPNEDKGFTDENGDGINDIPNG